jgi:hypothetical protein
MRLAKARQKIKMDPGLRRDDAAAPDHNIVQQE